MNRVWFSLCMCGLALLAVLFQASPSSAQLRPEVCVTDDLSRRVCIPAFPSRVVSLAPSLTEIMFHLGAGGRLVGRTARCNEPAEAAKIKDVGAYMNPDLERIIFLRPDLVLCPFVGMRKEFVNRLTEVGIPVFVDNSNNLDEITHLVGRLGTLLGKDDDTRALVRAFEQRRRSMADLVADAAKPRILFAIGVRPLVVAGGKSFIGSLIREAGGVNVAEDAPIPYPRFSMEEVIRHDPDLIVVANKECSGAECSNQWKAHKTLGAMRNDKIYEMDADLMTRPSLKIMDALEQLAAIFHPELFGKTMSAGQAGSR